jgi:hypothetical protein
MKQEDIKILSMAFDGGQLNVDYSINGKIDNIDVLLKDGKVVVKSDGLLCGMSKEESAEAVLMIADKIACYSVRLKKSAKTGKSQT